MKETCPCPVQSLPLSPCPAQPALCCPSRPTGSYHSQQHSQHSARWGPLCRAPGRAVGSAAPSTATCWGSSEQWHEGLGRDEPQLCYAKAFASGLLAMGGSCKWPAVPPAIGAQQ